MEIKLHYQEKGEGEGDAEQNDDDIQESAEQAALPFDSIFDHGPFLEHGRFSAWHGKYLLSRYKS